MVPRMTQRSRSAASGSVSNCNCWDKNVDRFGTSQIDEMCGALAQGCVEH